MLPAIGTAKTGSRISFWVIASERGFRGHAGKGWESQQKKTDLNSQAGKTRCAPVSAGQGVVLHDVSARPL